MYGNRDPHTVLVFTLVNSLQASDSQECQNAQIALEQMGRPHVVGLLIAEMHNGTADGKWEAIRGLGILIRASTTLMELKEISGLMEDEMGAIGENPQDGHERFVRIALGKLDAAALEMIRGKEAELRSILSQGEPKPPKAMRATPKPHRRASHASLKKLHRSRAAMQRIKGSGR